MIFSAKIKIEIEVIIVYNINSVEIDLETIKRDCPLDSRENALDYITAKAREAAPDDLHLYRKIWNVLWYHVIPLSLD